MTLESHAPLPPLRVSPLIKFFRYAFLVWGIRRGISQQEFYRDRYKVENAKYFRRELFEKISALKEKPYEEIFPDEELTNGGEDSD
ncbi:unnamed protein product [Nesidiocoris tenuis]|uniref:ATP synthase F(0) complex subunit e, mitochondrial n=2 Tax=Nesidiocoris tenuis TaxID=355587 RepID=A0A6H5G2X3_9HEMI|nr:Hypothetical protein NTJ_02443 [Nesidiocoris tenuis]CAA9996151.1 unnamed protein product [Nesidiocoris tenuis]CAA9996152.1 unnamed protein product [Nesidiocoris tenuis]